jgi:hypothetical protein
MLGKGSIIGAVAGILMIPTALSAQMGGTVNPAVHVGGAVTPALPFAVPSSEVFLARTWGLGGRRMGKFTAVVSGVRPPQSSTGDRLAACDADVGWMCPESHIAKCSHPLCQNFPRR